MGKEMDILKQVQDRMLDNMPLEMLKETIDSYLKELQKFPVGPPQWMRTQDSRPEHKKVVFGFFYPEQHVMLLQYRVPFWWGFGMLDREFSDLYDPATTEGPVNWSPVPGFLLEWVPDGTPGECPRVPEGQGKGLARLSSIITENQ